jgi:putative ABC transport system permease protein
MRNWWIVCKDLRTNRLRSVLTALSMFVGVLAVVGVASAGTIAGEVMVSKAEQQSGRAATFQTTVTLGDGVETAERLYADLKRRVGPQPAGILLESSRSVYVVAGQGRDSTPVEIAYSIGDPGSVRRLPVLAGSFPAGSEVYPPRVAVNQVASQALGIKTGDTVKLARSADGQPVSFVVVAEVADANQLAKLYAPMSATVLLQESLRNAEVGVLVHASPSAYQRVTEVLTAALVTSVVGSLAPALKASRLPVAQALRA